MTERFQKFIGFIHRWEDVLDKHGNVISEKDSSDPGGLTKYGIDKRAHPNVDIEALDKERADAIYFDEWTKEGIESMGDKIGEAYFNCAVNCGTGRANKIMSRAGSDADGFINEQEAFYHRLAKAKPEAHKFLVGWLNRTEDLRKFLEI